jgi:hypothetical protein
VEGGRARAAAGGGRVSASDGVWCTSQTARGERVWTACLALRDAGHAKARARAARRVCSGRAMRTRRYWQLRLALLGEVSQSQTSVATHGATGLPRDRPMHHLRYATLAHAQPIQRGTNVGGASRSELGRCVMVRRRVSGGRGDVSMCSVTNERVHAKALVLRGPCEYSRVRAHVHMWCCCPVNAAIRWRSLGCHGHGSA